MKYITAKIDLGEKETFQKYNGKFLEESDAQDLITVTEDTAIMKPIASLDGSDVPLAYVVCDAFPNDNVRNVLATIEDTSTPAFVSVSRLFVIFSVVPLNSENCLPYLSETYFLNA